MRSIRPSLSVVISLLALTVSLSGAGYAAVVVGTSDLANNAVTSPKIKNSTIKTKDLSPKTVAGLKGRTGPAGATGQTGATGAAGAPGAAGAAGAAGSARAYAVVNSGTLVSARTKGFSAVTNPATGIYCLTLTDSAIDPATIAPIVTVDWFSSTGDSLSAYVSLSAFGCPGGTDVGVRTYTWSSVSESAPSGGVDFLILVP